MSYCDEDDDACISSQGGDAMVYSVSGLPHTEMQPLTFSLKPCRANSSDSRESSMSAAELGGKWRRSFGIGVTSR